MPPAPARITVAAMSTLDDWIAQASTALDLPADSCPPNFATNCWT